MSRALRRDAGAGARSSPRHITRTSAVLDRATAATRPASRRLLVGESGLKSSLLPVALGFSHERDQSCKNPPLPSQGEQAAGGARQSWVSGDKASRTRDVPGPCVTFADLKDMEEGSLPAKGKQCPGGQWKSENVVRDFFSKMGIFQRHREQRAPKPQLQKALGFP